MTTKTFPRALVATLGATLALATGGASAMTTPCADFMAMSAEDQMGEVAMMRDSVAAEPWRRATRWRPPRTDPGPWQAAARSRRAAPPLSR